MRVLVVVVEGGGYMVVLQQVHSFVESHYFGCNMIELG